MNKYKKIILIAISIIIVISVAVFVFLFLNKNKSERQVPQVNQKKEVQKEGTAEELIKDKIGDFTIEEEFDYQDGKIVKCLKQVGEMSAKYTFFYKDRKLQRLPDDYIIDSINYQLSDEEKNSKTVSFKYQDELETGAQDGEGNNIVYRDVFLMTKELPESQWVENAMYDGPAKYEISLMDEFGNFMFSFLSSRSFE